MLTFSVLNDLRISDPAMSAISDPIYNGEVIKGTFPIGSNEANFDVRNIKTDCKFITLIEPLGQHKDNNIYPLGEPGEKKSNMKINTDDKFTALLSGFRPEKADSANLVNIVSDMTKVQLSSSYNKPAF